MSDDRPVFNVDLRGLRRMADEGELIEGEASEDGADEGVPVLPDSAPGALRLEKAGKGGKQGVRGRKTTVDQWVEERMDSEG